MRVRVRARARARVSLALTLALTLGMAMLSMPVLRLLVGVAVLGMPVLSVAVLRLLGLLVGVVVVVAAAAALVLVAVLAALGMPMLSMPVLSLLVSVPMLGVTVLGLELGRLLGQGLLQCGHHLRLRHVDHPLEHLHTARGRSGRRLVAACSVGPATHVGRAEHLEDELRLAEQRDHALHRRAPLLRALDLVDHDRSRVLLILWKLILHPVGDLPNACESRFLLRVIVLGARLVEIDHESAASAAPRALRRQHAAARQEHHQRTGGNQGTTAQERENPWTRVVTQKDGHS